MGLGLRECKFLRLLALGGLVRARYARHTAESFVVKKCRKTQLFESKQRLTIVSTLSMGLAFLYQSFLFRPFLGQFFDSSLLRQDSR